MWALSFECGINTRSWYAELALRRRVNMSAIGSVMVMGFVPFSPRFPRAYGEAVDPGGSVSGSAGLGAEVAPGPERLVDATHQDDLVTPGSSPACAISRTQIRQSPNARYTARGRPHRWQRV